MKTLLKLLRAAALAIGAPVDGISFGVKVYVGTTAGSSVSNPPVLLSRLAGARSILGTSQSTQWSSASVRAGGLGLWQYISTNVTTDLTSVGFFTDGLALGMQIGDLMLVTEYTSAGSSFIAALGVLTSSNSSAGFNLTTLGLISSTRASSL